MLYPSVVVLAVVFFFTENFSMLYCCIDRKNVVRDKKFLQRRLFCLLFRPLQVTS